MKKENNILKKLATPIGVLATISIVPLSVFLANEYSKKEKYDFGLAVPTVNSLNYIKYGGQVGQVASSLVDGFVSPGPEGDLKNLLQLKPFNSYAYIRNEKDGKASWRGSVIRLSEMGVSSSSLVLSEDDKSFVVVQDGNGKIYDVLFRLNKKQKWRSGDSSWNEDKKNLRPVTGKDYVDSAKAILNLKNGSQQLTRFRELHIEGADDAYYAQSAYFKKNRNEKKKNYDTPFDGKLRRDGTIGKSDFKLGVTSGYDDLKNTIMVPQSAGAAKLKNPQTALDIAKEMVPESERENDKCNEWANYIVHYRFSTPVGYNTFLNAIQGPTFFPINKDFIDKHGGVEHFGNSLKNFAWNGPFDIKSLILGSQGSLVLEKSDKYFDKDHVIPNKVKLYFQEDPVIKGALFDDNAISFTRVPAIYHMKFWSDPEKRKYMNKNSGYGTIALAFNLDKEKNQNSPLQDENLRKAMSYAIDRERILKYAGWNSSFPVVAWTAFGQATDSKGRHLESHWDVNKNENGQWEGTTFKTENGKTFPIQNINWQDHAIKDHVFEHADRTDTGFDPATAKYYLDKYKKEHPNVSSVTLRYVDAGTPEQKNVFIGLTNLLERQFGSFIKLEEKTLPQNVFAQYKQTGQFDLIYENFDSYGSDISSYIKRFLWPDQIDTKELKTTGFRDNPSGSWTYTQFRDKKIKEKKWATLKDRLNISEAAWTKLNELIPNTTNTGSIEKLENEKEFLDFFSGVAKNGNPAPTDKLIAEVAASFEKLIREATPIIPLMEVDTYWRISRLIGIKSLQTINLKYVYDVENKPRPNLPGWGKE